MNETEHLNIPIPNPAADPPTHVNAEFERLRLAWQMVDLILYNLQIALADKADVDHIQAMETVTGLVDALAGKMAASRTFKLDDLTDVAGADEAAPNYVLVKTPGGWVPSTAIAALGLHNHLIDEVSGLVEALLAKADQATTYTKTEVSNLLSLQVPSYVKGLITSKSSAYVISVAAGDIKGNGIRVVNAGAFTKTLNAVWAAGSGNGGRLDAAAVTANTTYHLQALRKDSDGSFDWGYSLLPIPASVPAGYTWVGRFDWCYTNATPNAIWDYTQTDSIKAFPPTAWINTTGAVADALYTIPAVIPAPNGVKSLITCLVSMSSNANGSVSAAFNDADAQAANSGPIYVQAYVGGVVASAATGGGGKLKTNTSRQLRAVANFAASGGSVVAYLSSVEDFTLNRIY
ncbi:hypothetical protein [Rhizobium sp. CECT 9324]|uniref:hypothetical protein n=1 Tax=Rhizobium sp. CECT 9324 TaxID=2845820 RepID=UPI001E2BB9F3|nr:hypothetical protein [Rhizobium sp. CECT 9324]CAH0339568.1 hypothetical protein RHI9324_01219 [Rhizobium sp. CECT 9324]